MSVDISSNGYLLHYSENARIRALADRRRRQDQQSEHDQQAAAASTHVAPVAGAPTPAAAAAAAVSSSVEPADDDEKEDETLRPFVRPATTQQQQAQHSSPAEHLRSPLPDGQALPMVASYPRSPPVRVGHSTSTMHSASRGTTTSTDSTDVSANSTSYATAIRATGAGPPRTTIATQQQQSAAPIDEAPLVVPISSLPPAFSGARGLRMPPMLKGRFASVTLPSRLALLGRRGFRLLASLRPLYVGNSVLGYAHVWNSDWNLELFLLPWIFSKSAARMALFVRIMGGLLAILFLIVFFDLTPVHIGRVWVLGTMCALYTMYKLSEFRRAPDGVAAFCRSMGSPEIEEFMFSYSWKSSAEDVRTLAKALWETGVGVWIDTVKLCPGDEIRPMIRTIVNRVARVVVFLSPAYVASPNCAVEFVEAIQVPSKCLVCILEDIDPSIIEFLEDLGIDIVYGIPELIATLDSEVQDVENIEQPLAWWRAQNIVAGAASAASSSSSNSATSGLVPKGWTMIPKFSLHGRLFLPEKSLEVGPIYIQGDCLEAGRHIKLPYLIFTSFAGLAVNLWDIINKLTRRTHGALPGDDSNHATTEHSNFDFFWLFSFLLCNAIPFIAWRNLFETRHALHVSLKPLLASKSLGGGVKVRVIGPARHPIVRSLRTFLLLIGHDASAHPSLDIRQAISIIRANIAALAARREETGDPTLTYKYDGLRGVAELPDTDFSQLSGVSTATSASSTTIGGGSADGSTTHSEQVITVWVLTSLASRDALFGTEPFVFDRFSLFVWSGGEAGEREDPFTPDEMGRKLMRFLVLVAKWEKQLLAENLFSAIGVRCVDILHS